MADEAFALSPISARAAQPGEADYDAISAAFMETSRGRWFLSEYAKRNRNADTRMVLDAVARIEQNLAAQKDAAPDHRLAEALAAITQAVDEARTVASQALQGLVADDAIARIHGGARAIRKILNMLRDIGADGRIYDSMDSELSAIEAGCAKLVAADANAALDAAFDLIGRQIVAIEDGTEASAISEPASSRAILDEEMAAAASATASPSDIATELTDGRDTISATAPSVAGDAEAQDEAVLDLIALEMAVADFSDHQSTDACLSQPEPAVLPSSAQPVEPTAGPPFASAPEASLGASLIAQGIVRPPDIAAGDPLAPIRRMSQAEKIAFFS
jgi:hypothetical protein